MPTPPLGLAYIAAYTPPDWQITIVDENLSNLDFTCRPDLVGMTTYTTNINHIYEIATRFRNRGIPVVLGGIHASRAPEEAMRHADSVVIGEGEPVWPRVIADFMAGSLKPRYDAGIMDLSALLPPRRDLLPDGYDMDVIQTARGCPNNCEFCCVRAGGYRTRPVEAVVSEFASLKKKVVFVVDDNFIGTTTDDRQRAKDICEGIRIRKLGKWWVTQVSINFADDEELMRLAAASGCKAVLIGFESLDANNLRQMRKGQNLARGLSGMERAVARIHRHGIGVIGTFIIGGDYDTLATFNQILDFSRQAGLDALELQILSIYPGTGLIERLDREKRLMHTVFPRDWEGCTDVVMFRPRHMSSTELIRGYDYVMTRSHSRRAIFMRFFRTWFSTKKISTALFCLEWNREVAKDVVIDTQKPVRAGRDPMRPRIGGDGEA